MTVRIPDQEHLCLRCKKSLPGDSHSVWLRDRTHASRGWVYGVKTVGGDDITTDISIEWDTKKHGTVIGPVAQPWRRLSRPKSRSRRSRNGDRWAAIACIAQLGSATAVAERRQLSRNGDSRRGTATAVAERRQPSPRRQLSRKGYEDHQSAT